MQQSINFSLANFLQSAPSLLQCPVDDGIEVAFAGRSNAGKSSAINVLTRQSKLASTSKTPGRTQLMNFFSLVDGCRLVDLPGYGYAKVPRAIKQRWDLHLAEYLQRRKSLRGLILLMDVRHPLQAFDIQMVVWANEGSLPVHILLTKSDKLKRGPAKAALLQVNRYLQENRLDELVTSQLFSSLKRSGVDELDRRLQDWFLPLSPID